MKLNISLLAVFVVLALAVHFPCHAQGLGWGDVLPVGSSIEGNSSTDLLFSSGFSRFQQVYRANNFVTPSQVGGVLLQTIYFRLDATNGASFAGALTNVQINLGVTSLQPDSLSPVFANNIGVNYSNVFIGSPFLVANLSPGGGPQPLEIRFQLTQPYLYRPSDGNLLMDFQTREGSIFAQLDAWLRNNAGVSSVYGNLPDAAGQTSTLGLVTYFSGTLVVPEPASVLLIAIGAFVFLLFRNRKQT